MLHEWPWPLQQPDCSSHSFKLAVYFIFCLVSPAPSHVMKRSKVCSPLQLSKLLRSKISETVHPSPAQVPVSTLQSSAEPSPQAAFAGSV